MKSNPNCHQHNLFIEVEKEPLYHTYGRDNMHANRVGKIVKK